MALAVFILIGSLTILAPLVIYFAMGAKAKEILDGLKTWMAAHNAAIMTGAPARPRREADRRRDRGV